MIELDDASLAWAISHIKPKIAALNRWYKKNARDLPWRHTKDPYAIWVSEVMLQQTQVVTVIPYYQRWLKRFDSIESLADAKEDDVLRLWEGLGYYRRARHFHQAAKEVVARYQGHVPLDYKDFLSLPGIGRYTAAAVLSISDDQDCALVDGNVRRVLSRWLADDGKQDTKRLSFYEKIADGILPKGKAAIHNQAMMELGAICCTPKAPQCGSCPCASMCLALKSGNPQDYPLKAKRKAIPHRDLTVAIIYDQNKLLVYQRPYSGMLAGLWDLPHVEGRFDQKALAAHLKSDYDLKIKRAKPLKSVTHTYSHLKVSLHPLMIEAIRLKASKASEDTLYQWVNEKQLKKIALPRGAQKVLALLSAESIDSR